MQGKGTVVWQIRKAEASVYARGKLIVRFECTFDTHPKALSALALNRPIPCIRVKAPACQHSHSTLPFVNLARRRQQSVSQPAIPHHAYPRPHPTHPRPSHPTPPRPTTSTRRQPAAHSQSNACTHQSHPPPSNRLRTTQKRRPELPARVQPWRAPLARRRCASRPLSVRPSVRPFGAGTAARTTPCYRLLCAQPHAAATRKPHKRRAQEGANGAKTRRRF